LERLHTNRNNGENNTPDSGFSIGLSPAAMIRGAGDIYYDDRSGHALRIIPMVEVWSLQFLFCFSLSFNTGEIEQPAGHEALPARVLTRYGLRYIFSKDDQIVQS
jgi:hypothetical protein